MSPWWLLLIVPGALLAGAFAAFLATMIYISSGLRF